MKDMSPMLSFDLRPSPVACRWAARACCWLAVAAGLVAAVAACTGPAPGMPAARRLAPGTVEQLTVEILGTLPHDRDAFTQGLLLYDGFFYESTGIEGQSSLRKVEPKTGKVVQMAKLPAEVFGEGLGLAGGTLVQLTWKDGRAYTYALNDWQLTGRKVYAGEGWGLCYDNVGDLKGRWVMTNGSSSLTFRDVDNFQVTGQVSVTLKGKPVMELNELECVDGMMYANVWQTKQIVRIDPVTGLVNGDIDATPVLAALTDEDLRMSSGSGGGHGIDVLNGIAYDPATQHFFITGKWWPKIFEVRFVPAAGPTAGSTP